MLTTFPILESSSEPSLAISVGRTVKANQHMKTITNIIYLAFALFGFACFALAPQARAVCQQGCDTSNANTFLGDDALVNNTTGVNNTATGELALFLNTTGLSNTATGTNTLQNNVTGNENTATGYLALGSSNGDRNTVTGAFALLFSTGNSNIAVGYNASALREHSKEHLSLALAAQGYGVRPQDKRQRSTRGCALVGAFQGRNQADGQGQRSHPRA